MRIVDLISKKVQNQELTKEEISFIIKGFINNQIPDYQMSAFLMAIVFNGMTSKETSQLTLEMMHSGTVIDLSQIEGIKIDKHSTGGVGDKMTLIIGPIIAALGIPVAKMSGRGLGFTGGTIDKLESIPGFNTKLSHQEFIDQVNKIKISVIGQTEDLVPADRKMYALRDVTGTVESIPLIASSIMSKKLATGADAILLDVKCGSGAFMKDLESAVALSEEMIKIGKELKKDVRVEITNMDRPLGKQIGNKNEVLEAIEVLNGKGSKDLVELTYSSCETIILQAKLANTVEQAQELIDKVINDKTALNTFYQMIEYQNGDVNKLKASDFWNPKYKLEIKSDKDGYLNITSALGFGIVSSKLGAGRETKEDNIDFEAGITLNKKTNNLVFEGDLLFTLYSSNPIDEQLAEELKSSYLIENNVVENSVILRRMK